MTLDDAALVDFGNRITLALSVYVFLDIFGPLVDWDVDALVPPDPNAKKEKTLSDTLQEYGAKLHRQRQNFEAMADMVRARIMGQAPWSPPGAVPVPVRVVGPVFVAIPDEQENQRPNEIIPYIGMGAGFLGRLVATLLHPLHLPELEQIISDVVKLYGAVDAFGKQWDVQVGPVWKGLQPLIEQIKASVGELQTAATGIRLLMSQVWIAKVLAGFIDQVVLWSADRLTQIMRLIDGGYQAVAKVIGGFVDAIGFNVVTAVRTAIINALLVRLVNFINGKIIQIGMLIAAVFAGWEAVWDWLHQLWDRAAVAFQNAFLSALNTLGSALESIAKTLNSRTKGIIPVIPYTPHKLVPVPAVAQFDLTAAMWGGALAAWFTLESEFPTDYTADWTGSRSEYNIRNSWLGKNMAFPPEPERKQVPDLSPIPGVAASPVAKPPTAMSVSDIGGPQATGPNSLHMELAVPNLNAATVGDVARQIATWIHEDLALFRNSLAAAPKQ